MLGIYTELGRRVRAGELSLREARAFALDEYVGLPVGDPRSYRQVLADEFVAQVDIDPDATLAPDGAAHDLVEGAVSARWPATVLQHHRHVTVLCDEAAARRLELADYYRETFAHKPVWQSL